MTRKTKTRKPGEPYDVITRLYTPKEPSTSIAHCFHKPGHPPICKIADCDNVLQITCMQRSSIHPVDRVEAIKDIHEAYIQKLNRLQRILTSIATNKATITRRREVWTVTDDDPEDTLLTVQHDVMTDVNGETNVSIIITNGNKQIELHSFYPIMPQHIAVYKRVGRLAAAIRVFISYLESVVIN